jgi:hypothetical protein
LFSNFVCSSCRETIKAIYGSHSKELDNFNRSLRSFEQLSWSNLPCLYCTRSFKPLSYSFFTLFIVTDQKGMRAFLGWSDEILTSQQDLGYYPIMPQGKGFEESWKLEFNACTFNSAAVWYH